MVPKYDLVVLDEIEYRLESNEISFQQAMHDDADVKKTFKKRSCIYQMPKE